MVRLSGLVLSLSTAAAVAATAVPPPAAAAAPVDLLSHRAAYRLSLAEADPSSGLTSVRGGLVLEWRADCDGWLSQQRLGFVGGTAEGPGFTYDVRFSSWESRDNTKLRFSVRSFGETEMQEEFRGQAELQGEGGDGEVRYAVPSGKEVELPAGTVFPTEHVRRLIDAARTGLRTTSNDVFDGSGAEALTRVTAVIGASRQVEGTNGAPTATRWPVSLAYYPMDDTQTLPQFEIAFDLGDNGVLYNATLDYGDFSIKAELEKFESFAPPVCK